MQGEHLCAMGGRRRCRQSCIVVGALPGRLHGCWQCSADGKGGGQAAFCSAWLCPSFQDKGWSVSTAERRCLESCRLPAPALRACHDAGSGSRLLLWLLLAELVVRFQGASTGP